MDDKTIKPVYEMDDKTIKAAWELVDMIIENPYDNRTGLIAGALIEYSKLAKSKNKEDKKRAKNSLVFFNNVLDGIRRQNDAENFKAREEMKGRSVREQDDARFKEVMEFMREITYQ